MIRGQTLRPVVAYKTLKTVEHYSSAPKRGLGRLQEALADTVEGSPFFKTKLRSEGPRK